MIDLMEVGRRLWESGDTQASTSFTQARPALDLMELGRQLWDDETAESSSATIRNSSANAEPNDTGLSADPQNPQHPAPMREIEAIISSLVAAGHDVDARLAHRLRETMAPLSRRDRADLAIAVEDAMTATSDPDETSRRALALLGEASPKAPHRETIGNREPWIDWIAGRCPLLAEDRTFICRRMRTLPPRAAERTARRYVAIWHSAVEVEPSPVKQENAGRAAANRSLLALVR
ncbi:hypothetical protein F0A16_14155 [Salinicola corii]|uniref:Uncharacterized protein n=1 Tax=Salinicola corii TaxID=2606937 RepID=A0A640WC52_9GAMM|nr:hypothetical protein [Salinicola corii]KAA0017144.1 hypothetical protein F0A16_14155 [Salinicola corii]